MTFSESFAFVSVLFALGITPGPNNFLMLHSGMNYGWAKTFPLLMGIIVGFNSMIFVAVATFSALEARILQFSWALEVGSFLILTWFAVAIVRSTLPENHRNDLKPTLGFIHGCLFQIINPKAWVMVIALAGAFSLPEARFERAAKLVVLGAPTGLITLSLWAISGSVLVRFLQTPRQMRLANVTLGVSLFLTAVWLILL